jgi:C-terminal processing protease CtpA/Prc
LSIGLIYAGKEELKAIYNRYSDTEFEDDLPEFEIEIETQHQEEKPHNRKKSAKQLEIETQKKDEEQNATKSIQEVFRKLVAALHPDREPDEAERERKTKLMQRANIAYTKKDLLQLLALQLEIEQIDQTHLNTMTEERLKQFNKVLQAQFSELKQEIQQIEYPFKMQLKTSLHSNLQPQQVLKSLSVDIREMQLVLKYAKTELKEFRNPINLKAALKSYRF